MRFYQYISVRKVDMLYGQIRRPSTHSTTQVGADIKLFRFAHSRESRVDELNIYERLEAVEEWIYANEPVGSVEEALPWISARLHLRASRPPAPHDFEARVDHPLIFYSNAGDTLLLLGGSWDHLVGITADSLYPAGGSPVLTFTPWVLDNIEYLALEMFQRLPPEILPRPELNQDANGGHLYKSTTGSGYTVRGGNDTVDLGECEVLAKHTRFWR